MIITAIITIIAAYLIGSINFAVIFSRAFMHKDVRSMGSGNAGATNVLRNGGFLPGLLTFLCDALKGFVAALLGKLIFAYIFKETGALWVEPIYGAYICGAACMVGHVFPVFFGFKGGKGVATSVGIYAVCCPLAIVIGLTVFAVITAATRYVSLASVVAAVVVVIFSLVFYNSAALILPVVVFNLLMGFIVIVKHTQNIKRLLEGTESKIGVKKESK